MQNLNLQSLVTRPSLTRRVTNPKQESVRRHTPNPTRNAESAIRNPQSAIRNQDTVTDAESFANSIPHSLFRALRSFAKYLPLHTPPHPSRKIGTPSPRGEKGQFGAIDHSLTIGN